MFLVFVMELIVYRFGECATNPVHFCKIVDTGRNYALQTSELTQQLAPLLGPKARNTLQRRSPARFRTALTMARYREPVRFVSNLLNQQ